MCFMIAVLTKKNRRFYQILNNCKHLILYITLKICIFFVLASRTDKNKSTKPVTHLKVCFQA